ncbi:alpha-L-fucosidase [Verrucomicrobiota bacterium]
MRRLNFVVSFVLLVVFMALSVSWCSAASEDRKTDTVLGPEKADYDWWREARFGIFIHWNMSSMLDLAGGSWFRADRDKIAEKSFNKTSKEIPSFIADGSYLKYRGVRPVPMDVYDNLFHAFNPKDFNAKEWVDVFKKAGAKYIVFTIKHHDGFCMFDSAHTDYDIMNTPFGRDIAKELSDACHKAGIKVIWYYSKADWYDPRYDYKNPEPYSDYMAEQVRELCSNYGDIKGFWWDGGHIKLDVTKIFKIIDGLQPFSISNGRIGNAPGQTFSTPEQRLGSFKLHWPWETCAIMGEGWFWNGGNNIKSLHTCQRLLIDCAVGDGNLLLDFGPTGDGSIDPRIRKNFLGMGKWLKKYGESIYGTRGGPYKPGQWGGSTRKGKRIYLHVTQQWPGGVLELPPLPATITACTALTGGKPKYEHNDKGLRITLSESRHEQPDTIIVLDVDRDAMSIQPIETMFERPLNMDVIATASSAMGKSKGAAGAAFESVHEPGHISKHFGEDGNVLREGQARQKLPKEIREKSPWVNNHRGHVFRYWLAKSDVAQPWLAFETKDPIVFRRVSISEKSDRIKSFELQYEKDAEWKTFYKGKGIGTMSILLKESVTARKVRLFITSYSSDVKEEGPGIHTFDVFAR